MTNNENAQKELAEMLKNATGDAKTAAVAMATGYLAGLRDGLAKKTA